MMDPAIVDTVIFLAVVAGLFWMASWDTPEKRERRRHDISRRVLQDYIDARERVRQHFGSVEALTAYLDSHQEGK